MTAPDGQSSDQPRIAPDRNGTLFIYPGGSQVAPRIRASFQRPAYYRQSRTTAVGHAAGFSPVVRQRCRCAPRYQIETTESEIGNIRRPLTDCCKHVTGACSLLDKVYGGMIAKPRSWIIARERGKSV